MTRYSVFYIVCALLLSSCVHERPDFPEYPHGGNKKIRHIGTAELSQYRAATRAVTAGNKILFAGGFYTRYFDGPGLPSMSWRVETVDIYDAVTDTWRIDSLSQPRSRMATLSTGDKAFFAGGELTGEWQSSTYSYLVDIYNSTTDTWQVTSLGDRKQEVISALFNNKAYFIGGRLPSGRIINTIDIYDIASGTWQHSLSSASLIGKWAQSGNEVFIVRPSSDTVDVYNLATNSIRTLKLSASRNDIGIATAGHYVLFAGGNHGLDNPINVVDIYDTQTGTWTVDSLSQARSRISGIVAGNKVLFAGGQFNSSIGTGYSKVIDIYDVASHKWSRDSLSFGSFEPAGAVVGDKILIASGSEFSKIIDIYKIE